tara:strand:+ start:369 stop:611 length:243 start_codon:yes stop_codon:yes gene_type:complete
MNDKEMKQASKIMAQKMTNAREIIQKEACNIQQFVSTDHCPKNKMPRIRSIEVALGKIQRQVSELNALDGAMGMLADIKD